MSISHATEMRCPECGSKHKVRIWKSMNVTIDPEAKADLLHDRINLFSCKDCNFEGVVPVDLLYHDMEKRFCVWLFPFQRLENKDFLDGFTDNGQLKSVELQVGDMHHYLNNPHIVFSMEELVRYVMFRDRLASHKADTSLYGGWVCFSCDENIEPGDCYFCVQRLHQVKGDAAENKDKVGEAETSLQVCANCMTRAKIEKISFREPPLPLLRLEKEGLQQFARSRGDSRLKWEKRVRNRDGCSLCQRAISCGDAYTRIEITEEVSDRKSVKVKEAHTLAILCEDCAKDYMVWL